jgi:hypothetical protein
MALPIGSEPFSTILPGLCQLRHQRHLPLRRSKPMTP